MNGESCCGNESLRTSNETGTLRDETGRTREVLEALSVTVKQLDTISAVSAVQTFGRWTHIIWSAVIACIVGMWLLLALRQGVMLNRLHNLEMVLQERTARFERIEKGQAAIIERLQSEERR